MLPVTILPLLAVAVVAAPSGICPESCKCMPNGPKEIKAACMSVDFLDKLLPSHINQITELDLSELSLKSIPIKLKKLKRLKKLDLTGNLLSDINDFPNLNKLTHLSLRSNKLQRFSAKNLPNSITQLDLSFNQITHVDKLEKLNKLEKLDLNENMINCDCEFLKIRDVLLKHNVNFIYPTKCYSPKNVNDVPLLHVYCVNNVVLADDFLQNDEPNDEIEPDYVPSNVEVSASTEEDEGSGSGDAPSILVSNCHFDCSTLPPMDPIQTRVIKPLDSAPTENENKGENNDNKNENIENKDENKDENEDDKENIEGKGVGTRVLHEKINVEKKDPVEGEVKPEPKKNNTTYIVIGTLLVVMVALIVYAVMKRRRNRANRDVEVADKLPPVEMKPLMKPNGNETNPGIPEKVPLMNGQNGHTENGDPVQKTDDEPVELRPTVEEPVTPDATKRVTIKAKEYPSPKSPVMIQRQLNDDGRVVVTPSSPDN